MVILYITKTTYIIILRLCMSCPEIKAVRYFKMYAYMHIFTVMYSDLILSISVYVPMCLICGCPVCTHV